MSKFIIVDYYNPEGCYAVNADSEINAKKKFLHYMLDKDDNFCNDVWENDLRENYYMNNIDDLISI